MFTVPYSGPRPPTNYNGRYTITHGKECKRICGCELPKTRCAHDGARGPFLYFAAQPPRRRHRSTAASFEQIVRGRAINLSTFESLRLRAGRDVVQEPAGGGQRRPRRPAKPPAQSAPRSDSQPSSVPLREIKPRRAASQSAWFEFLSNPSDI